MDILLLIIGLGLILAGANFLTDGSAALAQRFRVPEFIIGLTVVAVGTSTPELVVSVLSAIAGKSDVAIGNVVGSNIFNVFVILGVCALIRPLPLTAGNIRRDIPFGVIVSLLLLALAADSYVFKGAADRIGRIDGIVMLLLYGALMWYTIRTTKRPEATAPDAGAKPGMAGWLMAAMIVGGLAGLIFGGEMFHENVAVLLDRYRIKLVALLNNLLNKAMIEVMESALQKAAGEGMDEFIQVFTDKYKEIIGGELTADTMPLLTGEQHSLLAYQIFRDEIMFGGFCQLIQNGYGGYIFDNPFAKVMRLWGAEEFSKLVYKAKKIYDANRKDLEKERTDDEFMAMYEQYEAFDDLEEAYLDMEEQVTTLVASYVDNHLELFAKIIK